MSTSTTFRRVCWLMSGCRSSMFMRLPSDSVGWAKALALLHHSKCLSYAVPTMEGAARVNVVGGHGARQAVPARNCRASAFAHPTRVDSHETASLRRG